MNKNEKIWLIIVILSLISGFIEFSYSFLFGNPKASSAIGMIIFPIIIAVFSIYVKYVKKEGTVMLGLFLNIIVAAGAWFVGGLIGGILFGM